ncbi:MAG TPA: helicase-related protein [Chloroflexota bacterium]|nr:helicase-related protein [Chloroflexota bacterium]
MVSVKTEKFNSPVDVFDLELDGTPHFFAEDVLVHNSVSIKNHESKCGQFVVDVLAPLAGRRRILTGLIAPRSPLDLFNQFRWLDPDILGYDSFVAFRARYASVKKVCIEPGEKLRGMLRSRLGLSGNLTRAELQLRAAAVDPDLNIRGMTPPEVREYLRVAAEGMPRDQMIDAIGRLGGYVQTIPVIDRYLNVDELYEKISPHSYRCRLEDCYDMPAADWAARDVEFHPEQRRIYEDLKKTATAELESLDHVTAEHVVVRIMRLHQVLCGHAVDEDGKIHPVPEKRTSALLELLEDYDGKAVVWCSYRYNVERVARALTKEYGDGSTAQFWGGNAGAREEESSRFKSDPACRFMVATPDAGRYGRDWSEADLCVFYSSRNNLDHRSQAEERVRAVGKTKMISYVDLRAPGTVDDKILSCLRNKIDLAAAIDGDAWREWVV